MASEYSIPTDLELDNLLWRFAGAFWLRTAARNACLELQAQGWSVTDLLCALWLASAGLPFKGLGDGRVLCWRSQVTEPLRQIRKTIPKGHPLTDTARNCIAHSELEAEKIELALAYRTLTATVDERKARNQLATGTGKTLALDNLQAAAPEKTMDDKTGKLLEFLAAELQMADSGEAEPC